MIGRFESREYSELTYPKGVKTVAAALLFLIVLCFVPRAGTAGQEQAVLFGTVKDARGEPAAGARVTIRQIDGQLSLTAVCDGEGFFDLCGLPPGEQTLTVERAGGAAPERHRLALEPGAALYARIVLPAGDAPGPGRLEFVDLSPSTGRTIIGEFQVKCLPSADNAWSLIENQDLSATANRIDVGGVWADLPALWSSRGSVSWTQSAYLLNGLDATDPYASGTPMFIPDIHSLAVTAHSDGRHDIRHLSPGGAFDFIPKQGTPVWHGAATLSVTPSGLTTSHIPARLIDENITERTRLNSLADAAGRVSGPLVPGKLLMFASVSRLDVSRDVAQFAADDKGKVTSGLVNLTYLLPRGSLQLLWTGQSVRHPTYGADRNVPVDSTVSQKSDFSVAQVLLRTHLSPGHALELGAAFNRGLLRSEFQEGVSGPHGEQVFTKVPSGAAAGAGRDDRTSMNIFGQGTAAFRTLGNIHHRLEYGASLRTASSSSEEKVFDNLHLRFSDAGPFEIVRFNTPLAHRERGLDFHVFVQDRLTFANLASLEVGLHAVKTRGWVPADNPAAGVSPPAGFPAAQEAAGEIRWTNLSPRLAFSLPLRRDGSMNLRVSAARYFFELPLSYLAYGNPGALGGLAYSWIDANSNGRFEDGERGALVRREGPYFASIDPGLERPRTDEYCVSFSKIFGDDHLLQPGRLLPRDAPARGNAQCRRPARRLRSVRPRRPRGQFHPRRSR